MVTVQLFTILWARRVSKSDVGELFSIRERVSSAWVKYLRERRERAVRVGGFWLWCSIHVRVEEQRAVEGLLRRLDVRELGLGPLPEVDDARPGQRRLGVLGRRCLPGRVLPQPPDVVVLCVGREVRGRGA